MHMNWYTKNSNAIAKQLEIDPSKGLSEKEAEKRLHVYGANRLAGKKPTPLILRFLAQLSDFMVLVLIAAAGLSFFISLWEGHADFIDPIIILAIVLLNAIMGLIQEARAERAIESLQKLSAPKTKVIRNAVEFTVDSATIVPGDILVFETGDAITADARILESVRLQVEESSLTGESLAVSKDARAQVAENAPLGERKNMLFSGTSVIAGRATAICVETGMQTEVGKIAALLDNTPQIQTPLQRRLASTGKIMAAVALVICGLIFFLGITQERDFLDSFMLSVSLAVAAVPEGLPAIVTIVLALGVQRLVRKNAILRKLPAVETLGSATVICSDKTGTLTQNIMQVTHFIGGNGTEIQGASTEKLLLYGSLCTNTRIQKDRSVLGAPTEIAIVQAALGQNTGIIQKHKLFPRLGEIPFDSTRKRMSTLHKDRDSNLLIVKGAPDVVLGFCTNYDSGSGISPLDSATRGNIIAQNAKMAENALRVIAVCYRQLDTARSTQTLSEKDEQKLIFLGLIAMQDPPRPEARQAVLECKRAGIRPVMITGDHALTALSIAKNLGIFGKQSDVLTGLDLDELSEKDLQKAVKQTAVFARVSPLHKSRIVAAFQKNGEIVAMTGDGVNDAPALKMADIGCAMGKTGTDVARDASDMILTDDNFATIVAAVREGRGIYQNMVKSVHFLLSCNVGEILVILIAIIMGMPAPLLPIQLLWVNLVTDSFPALALGAEKPDPDIMHRPPINPKSSMFSGGLGFDILIQGAMIGLLSLWAFFLGISAGDYTTGRTFAFAVLALSQLFHAFNVRSKKSLFTIGFFSNPKMVLAFVFCAFLQVVVIGHPVLAEIFGVHPLTFEQWRTVFFLAPIPLVVMEISKFFQNRSARL